MKLIYEKKEYLPIVLDTKIRIYIFLILKLDNI